MTEKKKQTINRLSEKAITLFLLYENVCQEIERLLSSEKEESNLDVLYQKSDGLVVCIDRNGYTYDNVPIDEYLKKLT